MFCLQPLPIKMFARRMFWTVKSKDFHPMHRSRIWKMTHDWLFCESLIKSFMRMSVKKMCCQYSSEAYICTVHTSEPQWEQYQKYVANADFQTKSKPIWIETGFHCSRFLIVKFYLLDLWNVEYDMSTYKYIFESMSVLHTHHTIIILIEPPDINHRHHAHTNNVKLSLCSSA